MKPIVEEGRRILRYGLVGLFTNFTLYILFVSLLWLGTAAVFASGLCYLLGVALSYMLNRRFTFASKARHAHDAPKFLVAYCLGFGATLVFIMALVRIFPPEIAQIVNIFMTAGVIYISLRLLRYGQEERPHVPRN